MTTFRRGDGGRPHLRIAAMVGAIAVACGLAVAACGADSGGAGASSDGAKALSNLGPFERKVLKDKAVSVAELLTSTQVYVECLTRSDIAYERGDPTNLGPSGIQTVIQVPGSEKSPDDYAAAVHEKAARCLDSVAAVEDVWVLQHQASQAEIDRSQRVFVACVRKAGLAVAQDASFADAGATARRLIQDSASAPVDPNTSQGRQLAAVSDCMGSVARSSQVALPGLRDALAELDTSGW